MNSSSKEKLVNQRNYNAVSPFQFCLQQILNFSSQYQLQDRLSIFQSVAPYASQYSVASLASNTKTFEKALNAHVGDKQCRLTFYGHFVGTMHQLKQKLSDHLKLKEKIFQMLGSGYIDEIFSYFENDLVSPANIVKYGYDNENIAEPL